MIETFEIKNYGKVGFFKVMLKIINFGFVMKMH